MHGQTLLIALAGVFAFAVSIVRAQDPVTHVTANDGSRVALTSGQPEPDHYDAPPAFGQLDTNRDDFVSREEAQGYLPLVNDFDNLARHANRISKKQFDTWVQTQGR